MACEHGNDPATCSWCAVMGTNSIAVGPGSWDEKVAERQRVERWHATYNAALTGLATSSLSGACVNDSHQLCVQAANKAHGPLKP